MNVERLYEIVVFLIEQEKALQLQGQFNELRSAMNDLVSHAANPAHQTRVIGVLDSIDNSLSALENHVTPAREKVIASIGGADYFDKATIDRIRGAMVQYAMTPAKVQEMVDQLVQKREEFLSNLRMLRQGLEAVQVTGKDAPVDPELVFVIPRDLFDNTLGNLAKELHTINSIIRQFSEAAIGHAEAVQVHEIASSDPSFGFGMNPATLAALAFAIKWLLDAWKQAEEIRKLRAETRKLGFAEEDVKMFDDRVLTIIDQKIADTKKELLDKVQSDGARKNELDIGLKWALEALLARIERGMTVEVRLLPAASEEEAEAAESTLTEIRKVSNLLIFPAVKESPILKLPAPNPPPGAPDDEGDKSA